MTTPTEYPAMTKATAPLKETGYQLANPYYWWLWENETTPELVWPQSVYVYDQMRRTDAQVGSVLRAVTLPVIRTPWRIEPNGARDEVVEHIADDLGLPIVGKNPKAPPRTRDKFSWSTHLTEALLMLPIGYSYFEQVYRIDETTGLAHLRKLALRPAKSIQKINVATDGGLISIEQYWAPSDGDPVPIGVDRLVAYIHAKEGGNWLGTSILRNCYKNWLLKDRLLRVQAQTIERNGMGIPLYTGQEDAPDLSGGLAMAKAWRAGESAGTAIPFGATLKLVGVEGTLPDAEPAVRYHDEQIARAVLAHFLNLDSQSHGSYALGASMGDFFILSLQTLAQQVADVATCHVIEDLVDVNWGPEEPAPRLVFDEIGSRQAATAEALRSLVDAGIVRPDEILEQASRQQYGLPPADPATMRTPPAPGGGEPPIPTDGTVTPGDVAPQPAGEYGAGSVAAAAAEPVEAKFDIHQLRDMIGRWTESGRGGRKSHTAAPKHAVGDVTHAVTPAAGQSAPATAAKKPRLAPADRAQRAKAMARQYATGDSVQDVADRHGVSFSTAHKILTDNGVQLRPRGGRGRKPSAPATPDRAGQTPDDGPPSSMSDLAHELEGLSYQDARAKLRGWGFTKAEIDDLIGSDKPSVSDLAAELDGLSLADQRAYLRKLGFTPGEIRGLLGVKAPVRAAGYDPHQPRIPGGHAGGGEWGSLGGAVSKAVKSMRDEATIRDTYDYDDPATGFRARVKHIRGGEMPHTSVYVEIAIHDRDGNQIGNAERVIRPDDQHAVDHGGLILLPGQQGQGFGTRYNERAEAAYRAAGIQQITLEANIDVGGFSWARAGYDFRTPHDRHEIAMRARQRMTAFNPETQAAIRAVADRPDFSPLQMAMVGWYPGATMWPGKQIMLGSHWGGVKKL